MDRYSEWDEKYRCPAVLPTVAFGKHTAVSRVIVALGGRLADILTKK
jgi:hypothetical protein